MAAVHSTLATAPGELMPPFDHVNRNYRRGGGSACCPKIARLRGFTPTSRRGRMRAMRFSEMGFRRCGSPHEL